MCGGLQHDAPSLARPQQRVSQSCCRPSGLLHVANMIGTDGFASSMSLLRSSSGARSISATIASASICIIYLHSARRSIDRAAITFSHWRWTLEPADLPRKSVKVGARERRPNSHCARRRREGRRIGRWRWKRRIRRWRGWSDARCGGTPGEHGRRHDNAVQTRTRQSIGLRCP